MDWLEKANQRVHQAAGEKPLDRFVKQSLRALPDPLPDFRETQTLKKILVSGMTVINVYMVSPRLVGKTVTLKSDEHTLSIYYAEYDALTLKKIK